MRISELKIKNFLSFGNEVQVFKFDDMKIFVGPNGSGKSNIFRAIEIATQCLTNYGYISFADLTGIEFADKDLNIELKVLLSNSEKDLIIKYLLTGALNFNDQQVFGDKPTDNNLETTKMDFRDKLSVYFAQEFNHFKISIVANKENNRYLDYYFSFGAENLKFKENKIFVEDFHEYKQGGSIFSETLINLYLRSREDESESLDNLISSYFKTSPNRRKRIEIKRPELNNIQSITLRSEYEAFFSELDKKGIKSDILSMNFYDLIHWIFTNSFIYVPEHRGLFKDQKDISTFTVSNLKNILFEFKMSSDPNLRSAYTKIQKNFEKIFEMSFDVSMKKRISNLSNFNADIFLDKSRQDFGSWEHEERGKNQIGYIGLSKEKLQLPSLELDLIFSNMGSTKWFSLNTAPGGAYELLLILTVLNLKDKIVLLDEPGRTLHPNLQKVLKEEFIDKLSEEIPEKSDTRKNHEINSRQILITTHSPYFIPHDFLQDITRVSKTKSGTIHRDLEGLELEDIENLNKFIEDINLKDIFFSKGVIFVEGITEKLILDDIDRHPEIHCNIYTNGWEVVSVDGTGNLANAVKVAEKLDVNWISIMDRNALFTRIENSDKDWDQSKIYELDEANYQNVKVHPLTKSIVGKVLLSLNEKEKFKDLLDNPNSVDSDMTSIINQLASKSPVFIWSEDDISEVVAKELEMADINKTDCLRLTVRRTIIEKISKSESSEFDTMMRFINRSMLKN